MADIATMNDLFMDEIRDLYDGEKQLIKALPKMAKAAHTDQLKQAFEAHLMETENQIARLEQIFNALGEKASGEKCDAMQGLIKEGEKMIDNTDEGDIRDAGLIAAAQRVEHYEMAGYGSARAFAENLGLNDAISLLEQTLQEEKAADTKLNTIAKSVVNRQAATVSGAGRYTTSIPN